MNILLLGGTKFLGRYLAEAALERNHEVTLFNRGLSNPGLFPAIEQLQGDRDGQLDALRGRQWDAVIDTCGYVPRVVRQSVQLLAGQTSHYTFISSISAYADFAQGPIDENSALGQLEDPDTEDIGAYYGPLKAACEQVVAEQFQSGTLIIRPGLIVGPHDPTDRFTYWPQRYAEGGTVLMPGAPGRPIQFIDVRDLAEWTIRMVEVKAGGAYNATGVHPSLTMGDLAEACERVTETNAKTEWVSEAFLHDQGVGEWMDLPLWVSERMNWLYFMNVSIHKALAGGLTFRPLEQTIADTLAWHRSRHPYTEWRAGLRPEREQELLRAYAAVEKA
ncbi:2'-hydroxyisoflavone reductase [Paenibacillus phyllosphaerae]|uniref:2'-hydroxyisoflavone reductase n=1 Tax=Paenibacillus phyllosphaerae TaxID=274593 RepID=A0A7W5FMN5_9BACL|nr:NAD-dependent epimerase/dehydratase family protein [Paenibacillus phyllosphaerae]MBB3110262.1 2'-hydroxyisoflavone reductase [Paenibacillus phyllosphaerae]